MDGVQSSQIGNKWAILIGIDQYHESLGCLHFCKADALLLRDALTSKPCGFVTKNIIVLADSEPPERSPTYGNIHSWLGSWLSRTEEPDLVLVYFAGNGRVVDGKGMLAPADATLDSLPVTGIPISYVQDLLSRCKAKRKIFVMDACHSGSGRDITTMTQAFRQAIEQGEGIYTIASCDSDQVSHEWPEKQHGVFTYFLGEALTGGAPSGTSGFVTADSVYSWTRQKVVDWAASRRLKQDPIRICRSKGEITLARRALTAEQRLQQAVFEIQTLKDLVAQQRETIESLETQLNKSSITKASLPPSIHYFYGEKSPSRVRAGNILLVIAIVFVGVSILGATLFLSYDARWLGICIPAGMIALILMIIGICLKRPLCNEMDKFYDSIARTLWENSNTIEVALVPTEEKSLKLEKNEDLLDQMQYFAEAGTELITALTRRGFKFVPTTQCNVYVKVTAFRRQFHQGSFRVRVGETKTSNVVLELQSPEHYWR